MFTDFISGKEKLKGNLEAEGGVMAARDALEAFFKAENERDWDAYRQFLHEEIVWRLFDKEERRICGILNYMQTMQKVYENSDVRFRCQDMQVSNEGNRVVAYLINDFGARSLDIFDFKDGLIYREYEFILD
ncbi:nuclear transport factor 2 family protein [Actinomyces sp. B33]|uniref:nuclear transport factor 2 family protein n=1 Tax=Actinomyces sp. B33 TaxID=2942131 RepID=UPI00233FFC4F|nr:nuclear transport factor 2 family protein [Actinomyces sp. B33]MDC4233195.1 nuclear transport factor 2 family protein [Actinomyces sp. B33]